MESHATSSIKKNKQTRKKIYVSENANIEGEPYKVTFEFFQIHMYWSKQLFMGMD